MLYRQDAGFVQNIAELHAAIKEKRPYAPSYFEVSLEAQSLEARNIRLFNEFIYLLGADGIHEARFEVKDVTAIGVQYRPRVVMAILGPAHLTKKPCIITLTSHTDRNSAEITALEYFDDIGVKANDFHELLHGVRASPTRDIAIEEI